MTEDKENMYRFFDKTADAKFQAFGNTLEDTFKNAQEAMISVMYSIEELTSYTFDDEKREVIVEGENLEKLLYSFLEETIFLMNAEFFIGVVEKIQIIRVDDKYKLKAILHGTQSINLESHGEIKAVTYNEMYVKYDEELGKYSAQVVVDL
ncbi:MAG: archease [Candidatus Woesearchaeota archaeon]